MIFFYPIPTKIFYRDNQVDFEIMCMQEAKKDFILVFRFYITDLN